MSKLLGTVSRFFKTNSSDEALVSSGLTNTGGVAINPSTEDKQDDANSALSNIEAAISDYAGDPMIAMSLGEKVLLSRVSSVNKFGRSTNVDSGVLTDVHDGANSTDNVTTWVAPTQARIHNIKSTSASDDGDPVGVGARTIRVYGLQDWDTAETFEDIILNGTTDVATLNSYVIIHRMKVLTSGATSINVGVITATAVTDGTVTAQINAGEGQTQMAIYGIPSTQKAAMTCFYGSLLRANLATNERHADINLRFNPNPDVQLTNFLVKHTTMVGTRANDPFIHCFYPYNVFSGPGILKIQSTGSADDLDVSAGFDIILVNN